MVRGSYFGYDNISSSLIHVKIIYINHLKGYAVKGFTFWLQIRKTIGSSPTYLYSY